MLNVDLSTLRGQELRQLLDTTRRRGDAAVTYEILQEMAVRRERGEPEPRRGLFGPKRPAEPRMIELNLGDPLDPKDPELEEAALAPAMAAPADWELEAPEDEDATYLHPPAPPEPEFDDRPPPPKPRRRALWLTTGVALGLVAGLALGGWAESVSREMHAAPLTVAAATPPPAPVAAAPAVDPIAVETETAPATPPPPPPPPPPVAATPLPPAPETAPPSQPAVEVAEETAPDPAKTAAKDTVKTAAVSADAKACAGQPTPADRIICGTPRLQHLQKDLREAYADALDAHQDRDLLREHQLAWREARNTVTEPQRLVELYEERIRKLKAATAEALKAR